MVLEGYKWFGVTGVLSDGAVEEEEQEKEVGSRS
jgi:hypothetical protein